MLITARDAARMLQDVVPTREHARLLLRSGLAGPATRTTAALLYDADAVGELADWPTVGSDTLDLACPHGLYIARLTRSVEIDVSRPWPDVAGQVTRQPPTPDIARALLAVRIAHYERLPWVATLFGFVVFAADAVSVQRAADASTRFGLDPPGEWSAALNGHRLPTRRGRPWEVRVPISAPAAR